MAGVLFTATGGGMKIYPALHSTQFVTSTMHNSELSVAWPILGWSQNLDCEAQHWSTILMNVFPKYKELVERRN